MEEDIDDAMEERALEEVAEQRWVLLAALPDARECEQRVVTLKDRVASWRKEVAPAKVQCFAWMIMGCWMLLAFGAHAHSRRRQHSPHA